MSMASQGKTVRCCLEPWAGTESQRFCHRISHTPDLRIPGLSDK